MSEPRKPTLRLRVSAAAERSARQRHPWIFAGSVQAQSRPGTAGELAVIYDRRNKFLAIGLFDPDSPIRVRLLQTGRPEPINRAWFAARWQQTFARREGMFANATTGYRCCNGESDGLPGVALDRYAGTLVLKIYTPSWLPWLEELETALVAATEGFERLILRLSRNTQDVARRQFQLSDGQLLRGPPLDGPVTFLENGLRLEADPVRGQKTGFFLDQRENRHMVRAMASAKSVLNLFSFSGAFSLAAAAGGARTALSLDISEHALAAARRNFTLNLAMPAVAACRHQTIQADAFDWLEASPRQLYDLVILDPPSMARRADERSAARAAYGKLIKAAARRTAPGGMLVACSCSAHIKRDEFFALARQTLRENRRPIAREETTGHPPDHPAAFPEAEYLKAIYLTLA